VHDARAGHRAGFFVARWRRLPVFLLLLTGAALHFAAALASSGSCQNFGQIE
jgi:hypothetical protein